MNVARLLSKAAVAYRDRPALRWGDASLTYGELDDLVSRTAAGLVGRGVGHGDRVAIFMRNRPEYAVALLAVMRAGGCVVPVNVKLHARELAYVLANAEARALVLGGEEAEAVEQALAESPVQVLVRVGDGGPGEAFASVLAAAGDGLADAEVAPDDLAWLFYTSGTTGFPKGAMLTHRNLVAMTMNTLADVVAFDREDVVLHAAPLSHGCGLYLLASLARGADNLLYAGAGFDPAEVVGLLERERVSVIAFLAPTMIVRLLDAPPADTSALRCVVYGGAPMHVDTIRRALARFGQVFVQIYGQGEAPMTISALRREDHDPDDAEALASTGIARTDVEIRIVDEDGRDVAPGETGEVAVRGDVVMRGYWRNEEATSRSLREGWLHTGDIGRLDERGRLFLLDRKNDMIISGGSNIYPREVEEVLVQHPGVGEAIVFGLPDPEWGENVVACVVPAAGASPTADELIAFCRDHLASFKKPKRVELLDALPKNAYGKVLRRELRDRLLAEDAAP
ncbi:MAG: long-chain fatty acid--CoA ligase [Thermoleophilia bacterium]